MWRFLFACAGENDRSNPPLLTGDSGVAVVGKLSPIYLLTEPGAGVVQTHATVAWGIDEFLVGFVVGLAPATQAIVQLFEPDGTPRSPPTRVSGAEVPGDKPDVGWGGGSYKVAWSVPLGRVLLGTLGEDGVLVGPPTTLVDSALEVDAVDLALQPDGAGTAIWTEFRQGSADNDDGRIAWRAFDAAGAPVGGPRLADESSRKTSDAAAGGDGGWVAVWARDVAHPTDEGLSYYEVWGRLYGLDGTAWTFRADDLSRAWPSRPAVAVCPTAAGVAVAWRDKTESDGAGKGSGAYVRGFDSLANPLGPSIALGPDGDGDRVVVDFVGELAAVAWQETDTDGLPGIRLSIVDLFAGEIVVDRLALHEPGGDRDERPSIATRPGTTDLLVVWETLSTTGEGRGLRARTISLGTE